MTKLDALVNTLNQSRHHERICIDYTKVLISTMLERFGVVEKDKKNTISIVPVALNEGDRLVMGNPNFAMSTNGTLRCDLLLHLQATNDQHTYEGDTGVDMPFSLTIQKAKKKHDNGNEMDSFTASAEGVTMFLPPDAYGESRSEREKFIDAVGDALNKRLKSLLSCP